LNLESPKKSRPGLTSRLVALAIEASHTEVDVPADPPPQVTPALLARLAWQWKGAILGTLLVLVGLGAAILTVYARRAENLELVKYASLSSLIIAGLIVLLVVPPLAKRASGELSRVIPLEVTKGGMLVVCITMIVAFAAWNTGNNLLFLVLAVMAASVFVAFFAGRSALADLIVSARFPDHIFAGEPAPVLVTLRNQKRLFPSFSVFIEARGDEEPEKERKFWQKPRFINRALAYFVYVPRRAAAEQRVEQLFAKRGHILINGFELSTGFPFGFFRYKRRLKARDVDLIVYPRPETTGDQLHLLPMNAGRLASARRGAGYELLSLRDYQPQDDLRHIDWKATAKASRLMVREFIAEDDRRITIALDTARRGGMDAKEFNERFERGVTQAASLVKHFIDERADVRLILGAEASAFGSGAEHFYACLRRLALVQPQLTGEGNAADELERIPLGPSGESNYTLLLTTSTPGSIPARIWRTSHVIYF
jgi:uncharacterized protein (DUF58 family)